MMQLLLRATHVLIVAAAALLPGAANAGRSDWADTGQARLRLLASHAKGGAITSGVEIALSPGWHTYWRNPGDAGVPPQFDFSASDNLGAIEVQFPTPERLDDGMAVSAIYADQVVFPVILTPKDAASPVTLRLDASFGVCNDVCIPASATVELTILSASDDDPLATAILQEAERRLPGQPSPGHFDIESVWPEGDDALAITVRMPTSSYSDLFVDGPAGWPLGQPTFVSRVADVSHYRLSLVGRPENERLSGQNFRFVAVSGSTSIEETVPVP